MEKVIVGFDETKQVIKLVIGIGRGIELSLKDDKFTLADLPNFFAVIMDLLPAIDGIEDVALEFKLATEEEVEELKAYVKAELDLEDDKVEEFIEDAFAVVLDIYHVLKRYFITTPLPNLQPAPPSEGENSEETAPATD
jgi:hypothetical protein